MGQMENASEHTTPTSSALLFSFSIKNPFSAAPRRMMNKSLRTALHCTVGGEWTVERPYKSPPLPKSRIFGRRKILVAIPFSFLAQDQGAKAARFSADWISLRINVENRGG
jgi:hypothetical protein